MTTSNRGSEINVEELISEDVRGRYNHHYILRDTHAQLMNAHILRLYVEGNEDFKREASGTFQLGQTQVHAEDFDLTMIGFHTKSDDLYEKIKESGANDDSLCDVDIKQQHDDSYDDNEGNGGGVVPILSLHGGGRGGETALGAIDLLQRNFDTDDEDDEDHAYDETQYPSEYHQSTLLSSKQGAKKASDFSSFNFVTIQTKRHAHRSYTDRSLSSVVWNSLRNRMLSDFSYAVHGPCSSEEKEEEKEQFHVTATIKHLNPSQFYEDQSGQAPDTSFFLVLSYNDHAEAFRHICAWHEKHILLHSRFLARRDEIPQEDVKKRRKIATYDAFIPQSQTEGLGMRQTKRRRLTTRGGWTESKSINVRDIDSVILPKEKKDALVSHLRNFFDPEERSYYRKFHVPYKRSCMFYGPPGTGKTSMIQSIATEFGLDISVLRLSDPRLSDDTLKDIVADIPHRSVLVLEDIDSAFTKDRKNKAANHLSFSGLLNVLDGLLTLDAQLIIMTTNHKEQLDEAMLRSGRVDYFLEFDYINEEQVVDMAKVHKKDSTEEERRDFAEQYLMRFPKTTPANLQGLFIRYRLNSLAEITKLVKVRDQLDARGLPKPQAE